MAGNVATLPASQLNDLATDVSVGTPAQGATLYRGASKWNSLAAGTSGQVLTSGGAGANPSWATPKKRSCYIVLLSGYTPTGTGADVYEAVVPHSPADGTTSITWTLRRVDFRVNVAGGAPAVKVQKSTVGDAAFGAGTDMDTVTLASGGYEASTTSSFDNSSVASGNKLRANVVTLGTATGWSVGVLLEEA